MSDHPRLFRSLYGSLKPGGWLVAQCGGGPNIAWLMRRASVLMSPEPYAAYFSGCMDTKVFADDITTAERLRAAGFAEVETGLEPAPTVLAGDDDFREFLTTVNMHSHLARLPEGPRAGSSSRSSQSRPPRTTRPTRSITAA